MIVLKANHVQESYNGGRTGLCPYCGKIVYSMRNNCEWCGRLVDFPPKIEYNNTGDTNNGKVTETALG